MTQILELARGEIPGIDEPWVMVDIRRMLTSSGVSGPREAEGGYTYYADWQHPLDIKEAIHEATLLAARKGIQSIYVRGRNG